MAAITISTTPAPPLGDVWLIRTATAQASTGQTDWIAVPNAAKYATVYFNLTAVAGTTPSHLPSVKGAEPYAVNDTYSMKIAEHAALTAFTAANLLVMDIGPGVLGIADDVTNSATVFSRVALNANLPALMGFTILNDRGDGDETYSYTVSVVFR